MEGIALRYWSTDKGGIVEHVLHIEEADDRSAKGLLEIIKKTLGSYGISLHDGLVSNTFDGASVMPGAKGLYKTLGNT